MFQAAGRFAEAALHDLAQVEPGGVHDDRVRGGAQRGDGALGVVLVPAALLGEDLLERNGEAPVRQLGVPALRPRAVGGGEEELHLRGGEDHGSDVAALEDRASCRGAPQVALQLEQLLPHHRPGRDHRGPAADLRRANGLGHVLAAQQDPVGVELEPEAGVQQLAKPLVVIPGDACATRGQGHRPVDGSGVDDGEAQPPGQLAGDRALARPRRPIDGDDPYRHRGEITRPGEHIKNSGVHRQQQDQPDHGDSRYAPGQPPLWSPVGLRKLLLLVPRRGSAGPATHPHHQRDRRESARPPEQEDECEREGDADRERLHGGRKLCAPVATWLVQRGRQGSRRFGMVPGPMRTLALSMLLAASAAAQQQDFSKVEVKATKVAGNVYMLTGPGRNIGASDGQDGVSSGDDQFAPLAPKIQAALKQLSPQPVRFVINTHWHGDHTGGNAAFADTAAILAHANVRKRMMIGGKTAFVEFPPATGKALPVVTFEQSLSLWWNGEEIRAIHFRRGHTDGDTSYGCAMTNAAGARASTQSRERRSVRGSSAAKLSSSTTRSAPCKRARAM